MPDNERPTHEELQITAALAAAEMETRVIGDWEASRLAAQFHDGQRSYLYSFASTGNVDVAGCFRELVITADEAGRTQRDHEWLHALGRYVLTHSRQGPVRSWQILTADRSAPYLGRIASSVRPI